MDGGVGDLGAPISEGAGGAGGGIAGAGAGANGDFSLPTSVNVGGGPGASFGSAGAGLDLGSLGFSGANPGGGGGAGLPATPASMPSMLAGSPGGGAAPNGLGPAAVATAIPNGGDINLPTPNATPDQNLSANYDPKNIVGADQYKAQNTPALQASLSPVHPINQFLATLGYGQPSFNRNVVAGGLLGGTLLNGLLPNGQTKALKSLANQERGLAATLLPQVQGELNGQLPAGAEAYLQQADAAARANIASRDAQLGISGSSMEGQDYASESRALAAERFQIAEQLASQGLSGLQSANSGAAALLQAILSNTTSRDNALGGALANFAGAMVRPQYLIGTGG